MSQQQVRLSSPLPSKMRGAIPAPEPSAETGAPIRAVARLRPEADDYDHVLRARAEPSDPLPVWVEVRPSLRSAAFVAPDDDDDDGSDGRDGLRTESDAHLGGDDGGEGGATAAKAAKAAKAARAKRATTALDQTVNQAEQTVRFDLVFGPAASQYDVYRRAAQPLVRAAALEGFAASIIAHGPCGAGKSHTLFGEAGNPGECGSHSVSESVSQCMESEQESDRTTTSSVDRNIDAH